MRKFKDAPYSAWYRCLTRSKQQQQQNIRLVTNKMTTYLLKSMRFKLINQANSECTFIGHWVRRGKPLSVFEKTYRNWVKAPIYIKDTSGALIFNPNKDFCWMELWKLECESWTLDDDETACFN